MLFGPELLETLSAAQLPSDAATVMNTFQWLLILGFPIEIAAAKAMPELFSESHRPNTDGRRVWTA